MPGKGKPFKKGNQAGKGKGRPSMPKDLKEVKSLTKSHVEKVMNKFADMTKAEIEAVIRDPNTTMLEHMVGSIAIKAVKDGDQQRLNFLLDRTIGKVKEVKEIVLPEPTYIQRTSGEVLELGVALDALEED